MSAERFHPSVQQVRQMREDTGNGLYDCRRTLIKAAVRAELEIIEPKTYNERVMRDALLALLDMR